MLRCQEFEVNHYDFTLGRLAYESLRPVQDSGRKVGSCFVARSGNEPRATDYELNCGVKYGRIPMRRV